MTAASFSGAITKTADKTIRNSQIVFFIYIPPQQMFRRLRRLFFSPGGAKNGKIFLEIYIFYPRSSVASKRHHRINLAGPPGREIAGRERRREQRERGRAERANVHRADSVQIGMHRAADQISAS